MQKRQIDLSYWRKFWIYCKEFVKKHKFEELLKNVKNTFHIPSLDLDLSNFRRFFNLSRDLVPLIVKIQYWSLNHFPHKTNPRNICWGPVTGGSGKCQEFCSLSSFWDYRVGTIYKWVHSLFKYGQLKDLPQLSVLSPIPSAIAVAVFIDPLRKLKPA